ncbi:uncharacterized protein [Prorops nasuta]|uniref:uncharacterized protein n=1 Tax=Prorops nasuta TaxID=863751 RepID=UPI0034CED7CF
MPEHIAKDLSKHPDSELLLPERQGLRSTFAKVAPLDPSQCLREEQPKSRLSEKRDQVEQRALQCNPNFRSESILFMDSTGVNCVNSVTYESTNYALEKSREDDGRESSSRPTETIYSTSLGFGLSAPLSLDDSLNPAIVPVPPIHHPPKSARSGTPSHLALSIVDDTAKHDNRNNDDDPPPYSPVAPPNHVGWRFDFLNGAYSDRCTAISSPLAPFLTDPVYQHTGNPSPYGPYKFNSQRYQFVHQDTFLSDDNPVRKAAIPKSRRYGVILVSAAVILFLMVLSLMVRFVVEKTFWRG